MKRVLIFASLCASAQTPATMKQLMVDLIHPAANDIQLFVNRGDSKDEREWAAVRRSAVTLAEAGALLAAKPRARDEAEWMKDAKFLADTGSAMYKAAQARDAKALAGRAEALDTSCTLCHKQYRPNVFPREGGSK